MPLWDLVAYRTLGQCHALSRSAFLMDNLDPSLRVFSFLGAVAKMGKIGSEPVPRRCHLRRREIDRCRNHVAVGAQSFASDRKSR